MVKNQLSKQFIILLYLIISLQVNANDFKTDVIANNIKFFARLNNYDPDRYNLLLERKRVEITNETQSIEFQGSEWKITQKIEPFQNSGQYKIVVSFKCLSGEVKNASVSVDMDFNDWSKNNYLLMPSAVYNGNRYEAVQRDYTPFFLSLSQMGVDKPIIISDHPRLNFRDGYSRIQERSGSMAVPSVGFHAPASKKGFWLCFSQANSLGDYGVDIEENKDRNKATISLTSPVVRELYKHSMCRMDEKPSTDELANFKSGNEVTTTFIVDFFESPNIQSLYTELKELRRIHYPASPKVNLIPFSKVFEIIETHKNIDIWNEKGFYGNNTNLNWMSGWCGGYIPAFALYAGGNSLTRKRVLQSFDWMSNALSPSGYYYDVYFNKSGFGSQGDKLPFGKDLVLTRKNAEGIYYAFKQFDLMKKLNFQVSAQWLNSNIKALDAQVNTYNKYKQLGQLINQQTGELIVGGTTCSGILPATLCAGYLYTGNLSYLETAKKVATYYYSNFIQKGLTNGGPFDAVQCFDSESAYGLLEGYVELYETTREVKWLTMAKETADQFSSWVVAYDYNFPPESDNGKVGTKSTGTVFANTQNKTAPAGICTHSGIALLKLYRATGDSFYLNLLRDIAHTIPQFMSWSEHQLPGYKDGWIYERCNLTDWQRGIGAMHTGSCWAETSMLLSVIELPGVYVNKSTNDVIVIDHLNAKFNKKGQIEITNPTKYNAVVKVLAETNEQRTKPLGQNAFLGWKKVEVMAGKSITVSLK
jgi:hypothetical protein